MFEAFKMLEPMTPYEKQVILAVILAVLAGMSYGLLIASRENRRLRDMLVESLYEIERLSRAPKNVPHPE